MTTEDFIRSVEDGIKLSKRIYFGKDRAVAPPKIPVTMDKSGIEAFLPKSPMVYAVICNPGIVDNPDIPSYQPHVHGRCDPPALIPLQMNRIELQVDCFFDRVFVQITGSWRVHCVMGSKSCDCRIAIPMGEQGSILGVEVEVHRKSYATEIIAVHDKKDEDKEPRSESGGYLKTNIFTVTVPKVDGGTILSIKASWMQKSQCNNGEFYVEVPFSFPEYVTPFAKKLPKKEKILLNLNSGSETEIICRNTSHPLKEVRREAGKLCFAYETDVLSWTHHDFTFSYAIPSSNVFGGVLLQTPAVHDADQREMFSVYLFPGDQQSKKVFRREIVFVIDISGSMEGRPIQATKNAILSALDKFEPKDSFNIIAFNGECSIFSSSMESATENAITKAFQWINSNFVPSGGTNISQALNKAIEMVSKKSGTIPLIFLVTDGTVEDERHICEAIKSECTVGEEIAPRIHTFGIGMYCNHHFLRMLAVLSRGEYDAAYEAVSIETRLQNFFSRALSTFLANVTLNALDNVHEFETFPSSLPDLSSEGSWIISGRYVGDVPDFFRVEGVLGDMSRFIVDLKTRKVKDIPLDKIFAKQQIDILTSYAWFSISKELEEKVSKMSVQTGVVSEYTHMSVVETERVYEGTEHHAGRRTSKKPKSEKGESASQRRILLPGMGIGFGNLAATMDNTRPGVEEQRLPEAAEMIIKAASNCCGRLYGDCCCMCCIQCCSRMNNQCAIALTQLCTALACFGCFECCAAICCSGEDGQ
ncbi:Inter alpha-trypsin inhibitor, heavy chain 4 [Linum grandiflorum]